MLQNKLKSKIKWSNKALANDISANVLLFKGSTVN